VVEAVIAFKRVAKREVEVALVVVERSARKPPVKVDDAVEMNPLRNPRVVEVELPQVSTVKGKVPAP